MKKLPIVLLFVLAFVVAFYIFQFGPLAPVGYLEGKVTIGPFMPVEPSNSSSAPPEVYLSRYLFYRHLKSWSLHCYINQLYIFRL
jgi:hypothetical protein